MTIPTQADGRTKLIDRRPAAVAVSPADYAASRQPRQAEEIPQAGRAWRSAFAAAVPAWLVGTLLVVALAELAARADKHRSVLGVSPAFAHDHLRALFMWDTNWYVSLARHGYAGNSHEAIRFFPLLPLTTRAVSVLGIPAPAAILLLCWLAAFGFAVLVYRLALLETRSALIARRATWLSQLAPGAFVLTMGYTEALSGLLAAAYLLAVRQFGANRRVGRLWLWGAVGCVAGFGSGLVRPTGFLIAVVAGLELLIRLIRHESLSVIDWTARLAMTLSPVVGVGGFLAWCHHVDGHYLSPYREQTVGGLRGSVASNPFSSAWRTFAVPTTHGENGGVGMMTLVLVVASAGLLWACIRRLPLSLSAWATLSLAAALTAPFFSSFPRYISGDIPLVIVVGTLPRSRVAWLWTLGASAALCAFFAYRAFTGAYTP